jgi:hypothetical protein
MRCQDFSRQPSKGSLCVKLAYIIVYKKFLVGRLPAKRITASLKVSNPFSGNLGDNKKVDNDVNDTIEFKYKFSHYIMIHGITPQRRHHCINAKV